MRQRSLSRATKSRRSCWSGAKFGSWDSCLSARSPLRKWERFRGKTVPAPEVGEGEGSEAKEAMAEQGPVPVAKEADVI